MRAVRDASIRTAGNNRLNRLGVATAEFFQLSLRQNFFSRIRIAGSLGSAHGNFRIVEGFPRFEVLVFVGECHGLQIEDGIGEKHLHVALCRGCHVGGDKVSLA